MANGAARTSELETDFSLIFDSDNHGRNIRVEEEGQVAHKVKKYVTKKGVLCIIYKYCVIVQTNITQLVSKFCTG